MNASSFFLPQVSHKATLSVTERGTEAAASTFLEFVRYSWPSIVKVDRPFLIFILENSSGSILFMGKINNPTAMWRHKLGKWESWSQVSPWRPHHDVDFIFLFIAQHDIKYTINRLKIFENDAIILFNFTHRPWWDIIVSHLIFPYQCYLTDPCPSLIHPNLVSPARYTNVFRPLKETLLVNIIHHIIRKKMK